MVKWLHAFVQSFDYQMLLTLIGILVTLLVMAFVLLMGVARNQEERRQERLDQIAVCERAFKYTRDQCTFIVDNHVMVLR